MSTLSRSSGMARFLAMLFAVILIFGLITAVPTPSDDFTEDSDNTLEARGNSPSSLREGVTLTRMGDTDFQPLTTRGAKFGSFGFNSCLGTLTVGEYGAILSHHAATDYDINCREWEQSNPKRAALTIPKKFNDNRAALGNNIKTYVYAQVREDKSLVSPELTQELVEIVATATGVVPKIKTYKENSEIGGWFIVKARSKPPHAVDWA